MTKESLSRKLSHGIFLLLSSSMISIGLSAIAIGFIARKLTVEDFGLFSTVASFVGLFEFLCDFGLNKTLLKFGSTDIEKTKVSFGNALFVKTILIIPTLLLVWILGYVFGYRGQTLNIILIFTLSIIFDSFGTVFSSIRRILGDFKLISFFRIVKTVLYLTIVYIALSYNNSVLSLVIATLTLSFISFIISLINSVLLLRPKLKLSLIKDFFKDSLIFSFSDFFLSIYAKISTVLLSFFANLHVVGIFSAAIKFTRIANIIPGQVKFAMLPTVYRILDDKNSKDSRKRVFDIILKYMIIIATPSAILIYFFSGQIIHLLFGRKYDLSIPLVQIFSLFIYLRFIATPFSLFFIGLHKHKNMLYCQASTTLLNILLNVLLIPRFASFGACYATIVSEAFFVIILISIGRKYLIWKVSDTVKAFLKPTLSGAISLLITAYCLDHINIFIRMIFLIFVYFLCLVLLKTFNSSDKDLLKKIFTKNKKVLADT